MAAVRYTSRAEFDLDEIADFTKRNWNELQVNKYLDGLEDLCVLLTKNPKLGRPYSEAHPTWRRMEHGSQVVFYREIKTGILVQRIMHKRMMPQKDGFL